MRQRPPDRLAQLMQTALRVFGAQGYRRTQMADVARGMRVAPGTLYHYVESKEALFYLVIDRAFLDLEEAPVLALPVPTPAPGVLVQRLRARLLGESQFPSLDAALHARAVDDPRAELEQLVRELYTRIARVREGLVMLERSALELPELAQVYTEMRRAVVGRVQTYLQTRIRQGLLRPVPHPAAMARLLVENVALFAMHRHREPDAAAIDDTAARDTVVDLLVHGLMAHGAAPVPPSRRRR